MNYDPWYFALYMPSEQLLLQSTIVPVGSLGNRFDVYKGDEAALKYNALQERHPSVAAVSIQVDQHVIDFAKALHLVKNQHPSLEEVLKNVR